MINYLKKASFVLLITISIIFLSNLSSNAASKPEKPTDVTACISGEKNIKLKWKSVEGASKYTVFRATTKKGKYKKVGTSKTTYFKNKGLTRGKTYYYKVTANAGKLSSKQSNPVKITVPTAKKALKEIRKALKNSAWVKENIKDQTTRNGYDDISNYNHELYFGKIKNKELVVVYDACPDAIAYQLFVVGYYNGKVTVNRLFEYMAAHYYNSGVSVDLNNSIVSYGSLHMGYETNVFYKISPIKFTEKDFLYNNVGSGDTPIVYSVNNKNVSKSKYNSTLKKYNKYNFKILKTKLTNKNIDKYVK